MTDTATSRQLHALYDEYHGWLQRWLRRKLRCPERAADLAQDTFAQLLEAQRRPQGFDAGALHTPRAYLTTTATRLLIDDARRRAIERRFLDALAAQPEAAAETSPENLFLLIERLAGLARLLEGLPERTRTAFLLYRLEGLTQPQIAKRLGVSPTRVKQYIAQVMVHCCTRGLMS